MNGEKPWWQSRTIWGAIIQALVVFYQSLAMIEGFIALPPIPPTILAIIGILFGVTITSGRVAASTRIGNKARVTPR